MDETTSSAAVHRIAGGVEHPAVDVGEPVIRSVELQVTAKPPLASAVSCGNWNLGVRRRGRDQEILPDRRPEFVRAGIHRVVAGAAVDRGVDCVALRRVEVTVSLPSPRMTVTVEVATPVPRDRRRSPHCRCRRRY